MPFNDPRLDAWSEVDWLREAAWLAIEWEDPMSPDEVAADEEFEEELELAAAGDWEALGLDPPPGPVDAGDASSPARAAGDGSTSTADTSLLDRDASANAGAFQPASVEEFMQP